VVKVPEGLPRQLGLTGFFYPTFEPTPFGARSAFPAARDPVLSLAAWTGDLGLDKGVPQSVYDLPVASLRHLANAQLSPGQTWRLHDGTTIRFAGVSEWATFQVAHDPGKRLVLLAAVAIVCGLLASLAVRRRRVWLRAVPAADGDDGPRSVVTTAGLARTDSAGFAREFDEIVQRMKD
jgi:cytochrome c biogenesis protein